MAMIYGSLFQDSEAVHAYQFDGNGGILPLDINANATAQSPFWVHYDYKTKASKNWIRNALLFNDVVKDALLGINHQGRIIRTGEGMLVTLQTLNSSQNSQPEHLVALRIFINSRFVVSTRHRVVNALEVVVDDFKKGLGAKTTGEWLVEVVDAITDDISYFTNQLHEQLIELEEHILNGEIPERGELALLRKRIIVLRRYMGSQRDVLSRLVAEKPSWMNDDERLRLHEVGERLGRCVEDLDGFVSRTAIIADEINSMMAELVNHRLYTMSLLAMVFLPTTFLTGLFGVNLGGIPGSESLLGFSLFCFLLVSLVGGVIWWLRKSRWL